MFGSRVMIIRQFLSWAGTAAPAERAEATAALARAFLHSPMSEAERGDCQAALTYLLDDPAPEVRFALADVFARRDDAPRPVVLALARDTALVAAPILEFSPLVPDCDLIDLAAEGSDAVQCAIARRRNLSAPVAAALAEVAGPEACAVLLDNPDAVIVSFSLSRLAERFADDAAVRSRLLARPGLPLTIRHTLLTALTDGLKAQALVLAGEALPESAETYLEEARERATVVLAAGATDAELGGLVEHLRARGQLTAQLMLRAAGMGRLRVLSACLSALCGQPQARVADLLATGRAGALRSLLMATGLPQRTVAVFQLMVEAYRAADCSFLQDQPPATTRAVMEEVSAGLEEMAVSGGVEDVFALMRVLVLEAAREEARLLVNTELLAAA